MKRNKRLEIVLILSLVTMVFFCICSINEKISKKRIYSKLNTYVDLNVSDTILKEKLTYNDKMYILYSGKKDSSEIIGYTEFEKNFFGWWCTSKEENTKQDYLAVSVDSVMNSKALLICGNNSNNKTYKLIITTPNKTYEKNIKEMSSYIYIEEINFNISKIKISYK